jgi:hypothetical protein
MLSTVFWYEQRHWANTVVGVVRPSERYFVLYHAPFSTCFVADTTACRRKPKYHHCHVDGSLSDRRRVSGFGRERTPTIFNNNVHWKGPRIFPHHPKSKGPPRIFPHPKSKGPRHHTSKKQSAPAPHIHQTAKRPTAPNIQKPSIPPQNGRGSSSQAATAAKPTTEKLARNTQERHGE